jgi:hypothetical protein
MRRNIDVIPKMLPRFQTPRTGWQQGVLNVPVLMVEPSLSKSVSDVLLSAAALLNRSGRLSGNRFVVVNKGNWMAPGMMCVVMQSKDGYGVEKAAWVEAVRVCDIYIAGFMDGYKMAGG